MYNIVAKISSELNAERWAEPSRVEPNQIEWRASARIQLNIQPKTILFTITDYYYYY